MAKDTEGNSSSHQDGRKLNRRYLLGGAAVTAGAGVAVWRGLGDRNEGQRDGDDDVSPESSEKGSEATTPGSSQITDVVGEDGFDLRLGSVHISAPAGVAEPGTQITLGLAAQPIPAEFSAFVKLAGQPVSIVLGDDEQPKQPVTIAFDLRGTELAANVSEITPLAVMSWSSIPDSFELMTGDWNAQSKALTVTTDHLSFEVPFLADIQKFITDTINGFLGLNYAKPECAFDPLTIGSTPYGISHTGNDPVWPCLGTDRNGQLVVDLHSNSNMAWAVKSLPSVSGSVSGDWKDIGPGLAAIYQGVFRILGEERAAVMPGGSVRLPFDPGLGEIRVEIRQSPALYVVTTTLQAIVSVLEALPTGQIAKSVYETFSAFDCITEVINTFYQEESSDIARSIVMTTVGCVSAMIEEQKGSVFNFAARTALAAIGMLSVAANTLIGAVQGIIREWTGNALASYTIAANVRETPDERTGTEVRGPSLDQPIVVKWRFEELGPVYSAPTIDSGTIYLAKQGGLYALDIASGQELWRGDPLYEPGESPVIFNDLVIFHSIYRAGGLLQAFDRRSGTVRWRIGGDGSWPGGCAIANGRLWFSSADILYTVDPATGNDPQEIRQRVSGSTYAFDNTVYAYGYATQPVKLAYLVAIDAASGAERWTFPGIIGATQLAVSADIVFAGSQSGRFHAIDAATGEERWSLPMGDFMSSRPGVADGLVFIDGPSTFSALDVATGEEHWTFSSGTDRVLGAQAIANGVVYVGSHNCLYALETTGGNEIWRYGIAENVVGGPEIAVGEGVVCAIYGSTNLVALGNLPQPILAADVVIRGTPSSTGAERGTAKAGTIISLSSSQNERDSGTWVAVTINGVGGWIPLDAIDPTTLPPEGEIEYVYMP